MARRPSLRTGLAAGCVAAALAVYANALANGFVHDDLQQVLENPWLHEWSSLPRIFVTGVWEFLGSTSNYYRPMMHVSYLFTNKIFGLHAWAFHLVNALYHAACTALVFVIVERLVRDARARRVPARRGRPAAEAPADDDGRAATWAAAGAALLFAVHPIHTEAVVWIAGFPDLSFTLFVLAGILFHVRWRAGGPPWTRAASLATYALALLSKEPALALPAVLFAYDLACTPRERLWARIRPYVPFVAITLGYVALRTVAIRGVSPIHRHGQLDGYELALNVFPLFAQYLGKTLVPIDLNAFYTLRPVHSLAEPRTLLAVAATAAFVGGLVWSFRRAPQAFVGLVLFAVPLLPVLYIPALGVNTFAERYLYLPSAGLVLVAALALDRVAAARRPLLPVAAAVVAVVAGAFAVGTVVRNRAWKDDFTLWTDTVVKSPDGVDPWNLLGLAYMEKGQPQDALRVYLRALENAPRSPMTLNNLGLAYEKLGLPDQAIAHYQLALQVRPDVPGLYHNLANAYEAKGEERRAMQLRYTAHQLEQARKRR